VSIGRACKIVDLARSLFYYKTKKDDTEVINKLESMVKELPSRGFDEYFGRIRNEGYKWNHKRVRRVYRLMKLNIRRRHKRRVPARVKEPLTVPQGLNYCWSADFMSDALVYGRKVRILNVMDDYNREVLAVEADFSMPAERVTEVMDQVIARRGKPRVIRVDNGPEYCSRTFVEWAEKHGIRIQYIQPGKPVQNAFIERLNRLFREDILDAYLFEDLEELRMLADEWMDDYNQNHPHSALGGLSPLAYIKSDKSKRA
jgi:putative transposase